MSQDTPVIVARDLARAFRMGRGEVRALDGVSLTVNRGEFLALMGPSGSGKSTFMNTLGCLDRPTSGSYLLEGTDVTGMSRDARAELRNERIGFVFQSFNLLPRTSALENVELPLLYSHHPRAGELAPRERAMAALKRVGIAQRHDHVPSQLSGGEQQRVAIARGLVNNPSLLLADEPTGNLDTRTSLEIMTLFQELNDEGRTVVIVTHEADVAACARRLVKFRDGRIVSDEPVTQRRLQAAGAAP